ncbi:MAG: hypothetical protein QOD98_644 [Nocardioidaceae bacterium]|nr:hypothetical protein [Nocardioidaceae bacterium]
MRKTIATIGAVLAGAALTFTAGGSSLAAGAGVIHVPSDFVPALGDTRATGHYAVQGTGLHVWTQSNTSTDKVAEYVATSALLASVGEPNLEFTNTSAGGVPGFQLVIDFDANGSPDGILVGEPVYGGDWWASNGSAQFVKDGAPSHAGGSGSANHGTLNQWRVAFPNANVLAFGFSLGSGVKGDGVIDAINFNGTRYTFAADVVLTSKDQCKNGGWATSTMPVYKNQGDCVSHFASGK